MDDHAELIQRAVELRQKFIVSRSPTDSPDRIALLDIYAALYARLGVNGRPALDEAIRVHAERWRAGRED